MNLDTSNIATIIVILMAVVGAVVVIIDAITNTGGYTVSSYFVDMAPFVGGLAVGRGIAAYQQNMAKRPSKH